MLLLFLFYISISFHSFPGFNDACGILETTSCTCPTETTTEPCPTCEPCATIGITEACPTVATTEPCPTIATTELCPTCSCADATSTAPQGCSDFGRLTVYIY